MKVVILKSTIVFSQAGGMDAANKLPKIKDQEKESKFGYVFAVSGPGEY